MQPLKPEEASGSGHPSPSVPWHLRILGGFLTLQGAVLVISLGLAKMHQSARHEEVVREQLAVTRSVFEYLLERRAAYLSASMEMLSGDVRFKPGANGRDGAAVQKAFQELRAVTQARGVWLLDRDGALLAAAAGSPPWPGGSILSASPQPPFHIRALEATPSQVLVVPIGGKGARTLLAASYPLDAALAERLKRQTLSDVVFEGDGRVSASTIPEDELRALGPRDRGLDASGTALSGPMGRRMLLLPIELGPAVRACLYRPWDQALESGRVLQRRLLLIGIVGFALSAIFGYLIAESFTRSMRELLDRLQRSNEELSRLNGFQKNFFSMVVHDAKNPLTAISGYAELLRGGAGGERVQRMAGAIYDGAQALNALLADLVDFAAIENGILRITLKPTEVRPILNAIRDRMEILAGKRRVRFLLEAPEDLPVLMADPARLSQVLQNLCSNAVQYTHPGGDVTLRVELIGDRLRFGVQDTGIGISPKDMERLFERFFQADDARKMRGSGFGLGLKIAREIVSAHGGSLDVSSQLGKGSHFHFNLLLPHLPSGKP